MWAFLSLLVIAPALVVIYDSSVVAPGNAKTGSSESTAPEASQKPFVEESTPEPRESSSDRDAEEQLPQWVQERSE